MKKLLYIFVFIMGMSVSAQPFYDLYKEDATRYISHFTQLLFEANIYNFADGWAHSAKPLKAFHVKLDVMVNYSLVPGKYQNFTFDPSEFHFVSVLDQNNNPVSGKVDLPTIFGGQSPYKLEVKAPAGSGTSYRYIVNVPQGIKDEFESAVDFVGVGMPGASLQLNVGLPLQTEVGIRFFPNSRFGPTGVGFWGLGIKHSVSQYLLGKDSNFHLSGLLAFSSGYVSGDYNNWNGVFRVNTWDLLALASYDMKFLSLYGGVGYIRGSSDLNVHGSFTYEYDIVDDFGNVLGTQSETLTDPIGNLHFTANELKFHLGAELNLVFLRIFAQYNIQKYPGYHAGISIKI